MKGVLLTVSKDKGSAVEFFNVADADNSGERKDCES